MARDNNKSNLVAVRGRFSSVDCNCLRNPPQIIYPANIIQCHAGQFLLEYSRLVENMEARQQCLQQAARDLGESIQSHGTLDSLASREQFHVFVNALYQVSLRYQESDNHQDREEGELLEAAASQLYEHYCSSSGSVALDRRIEGLINFCLGALGLKRFSERGSDSAEPNPSEAADLLPFRRRTENSPGPSGVISAEGDTSVYQSRDHSPATQGSKETRNKPNSFADRSAATKDSKDVRDISAASVDRSAVTVNSEEARSLASWSVDRSAATKDSEGSVPDSSVDRSAETRDSEEARSVSNSFVDQSVATEDSEGSAQDSSVHRSAETRDSEEARTMASMSVDRSAETRDSEEARSMASMSVDRSAEKRDSEEARSMASMSADRSAETRDSEEARSMASMSVDRSAATKDAEGSVPDSSVDRSVETKDSEEARSEPRTAVDRSAATKTSEGSAPDSSGGRSALTKDTKETRNEPFSSVGLRHPREEQRHPVIERSKRVQSEFSMVALYSIGRTAFTSIASFTRASLRLDKFKTRQGRKTCYFFRPHEQIKLVKENLSRRIKNLLVKTNFEKPNFELLAPMFNLRLIGEALRHH